MGDEDDVKEEVQATNCPEETIPEKPNPSGINLPIGEMTGDWMDGDVAIGSIESEDEESEETKTTQDGSTQQRNLALPQPSYASIASHEVSNIAQEPELP